METSPIHTSIGTNIVAEFIRYCQALGKDSFVLVTDQNEYRVLGRRVESALKAQGWDVLTVVLEGDPVAADDRYIVKILAALDNKERFVISVGSGTVTDMTRFVAYRIRSNFISLPTAPSMDGYASNGSSLTLDGLKQTVFSSPPVAIFADLDVLCQSPRDMIAAGFGDTFGKFTALADWALGGLLWNEFYSQEVADRVRRNLIRCVKLVEGADSHWEESIQALMEGLVDVGNCMLIVGNSRPASGSEHSLSHYWEMKLMREGRPVSYHGVKVGYASTLIARKYETIRSLSRQEAAELLAATPQPGREAEEASIYKVYGPIASRVIKSHEAFLSLDAASYAALQQRIVDQWDQVQAIAATVPTAEEMSQLLLTAGLPVDPAQIHLTSQDIAEAVEYGHYIRNPFTVVKLSRLLGINQRL